MTCSDFERLAMDKKTIIQMVREDIDRFRTDSEDISKTIDSMKNDAIKYIHDLLAQIGQTGSTPLLAKTPKLNRKRGTRIKAIPESDEFEIDSTMSNSASSTFSRADTMALETSDVRPTRAKRGASVRAVDNIKKQQSINLTSKLRRPSIEEGDTFLVNKAVKESQSKRPKLSLESSDEEDIRPSKQMKMDKKKKQPQTKNKINDETHDIISDSSHLPADDQTFTLASKSSKSSLKRKFEEKNDEVDTTITKEHLVKKNSSSNDEPIAKKANLSKPSLAKFQLGLDRISEKSTASSNNQEKNERTTRSSASLINAHSKKCNVNNIIDETTESNNADETIASIYEDATGKPLPIMNSTMNPNCVEGMGKMMSATVVIEPLAKKIINNDTITLMKSPFKEPLSRNNSTMKNTLVERSHNTLTPHTPRPRNAIRAHKDLNDLITDDESSPERKVYPIKKQKILPTQQKRVTRSSNASVSDEDEVKTSPMKTIQKNKGFGSAAKSSYKHAVLFSPYAKDSVKKRVEAFEQVAVSPKNDIEIAGRVTRTKTRALAAASFSEATQTVAQKLARKSLAKAKKISLAKHAKESDELKENENANVMKYLKMRESAEKSATKSQPKTTPLNKIRVLPQPTSANKNIYSTPNNQPSFNNYSKPLTASRGNIVTHVDSFIQQTKSACKPLDKTAEERRRRANEEDAKRKREELLRAQAEEKRRKREEKELKNKLAREAKEKSEQEKRLKAEREKEEKARMAQQALEKQREELEKRRIAQIQRAQEKEEKKKQEEKQKALRQQEHEELTRQLAEQKRREQEMEKRKQAEQRHILDMKKLQAVNASHHTKAKVLVPPKQVPCSYKIDSDPDEDESDDESKPKHQIPQWATKNARQPQLAMQQHIPMKLVLRYFDAKKCTPDLRELFTGIDPRKLKRSSSAIWKTPPRYSMMNCSIIKD